MRYSAIRWGVGAGLLVWMSAAGYACDAQPEQKAPFLTRWGPVKLRPSGFLEVIPEWRSATTGDTVSTRFDRIPVQATPDEGLISAGHSRMQLCAEAGPLSGYVETDFLNAPGRAPFRFRQYWGEYRIGKWRILAGQAWSLLRANRVGLESEGRLMNTLVVEPAYQVGLAGVRNRQVRIARDEGSWHFAVSYEGGRNFLAKAAHDTARLHWEAVGLGSVRRRAAGFAATIHAPRRIDVVTQQVVSQGAGRELLNTIPAGVRAYSTMLGVEARVRPMLELFAYGGMTYGGRSGGNRTVRQWTVGFLHHLFEEQPWGAASLAMQYSTVDRSTWGGGYGEVRYVQASFRYSIPGSRSMFSGRH